MSSECKGKGNEASDGASKGASEGAGKPPSPGAHEELAFYGWRHEGAGVYTHPERQGQRVLVLPAGPACRAPIAWTHRREDGASRTGEGIRSLAYHLMRDEQEAQTRESKGRGQG